MVSGAKAIFLSQLDEQYGPLRKLDKSQSLYEIADGAARVYIRYSRVHGGDKTFYGLRDEDLHRLSSHPSLICFVWDDQVEPLLVPFSEYEDVFQSTLPASDGQYKAQVYLLDDGAELYIAKAGRFNVEGHLGWHALESLVDSATLERTPNFSHSQVQTLLGAIGIAKNHAVWIPHSDRAKLDWTIADPFLSSDMLPSSFSAIKGILQEVDVIWIRRGSSDIRALFEVEHSTPIYSGLLRLNDIHLAAPTLLPRFSIVANDTRRSLFVRQLRRPTFQTSGLSKLCTFLEYVDVLRWYNRVGQ